MVRKLRFCCARALMQVQVPAGRALDTHIPAQIIAFTVAVFLQVFDVVLVVVTDQVLQRETVMAGDEIDTGVGAAAAVRV